jgi:hypothetical protein
MARRRSDERLWSNDGLTVLHSQMHSQEATYPSDSLSASDSQNVSMTSLARRSHTLH